MADYMKKKASYIVVTFMALVIIFLLVVVDIAPAYLQATPPVTPHFWIVTSTNENDAIGPLLNRYIQDIQPTLTQQYGSITVEKKLLNLDPNLSQNRQAYTVATTLENGYHNQNLKGALVINMPLPGVVNRGTEQVSLLPYGDFENKYFVFDSNNEKFTSQENVVRDNIHPEILLGYLPDLTPAGFQGYFEANHNYYTHGSSYNKAIFFNDQVNDDKLWNNLASAVHSPIDKQAFDPQNFTNVITSSEKSWKDALRSTRRWQSLPSLSSNQVRSYFNSWYDEPVLSTMMNILPQIATQFLNLPGTQDPNVLSQQENTMGEFLTQLGVFSGTVAIDHHLFSKYPTARGSEAVCNSVNSLPDPSSPNDEIQRIHNQINSLRSWITSVPRGSLLAKAEQGNSVTVDGTLQGQYFVIRPGSLVRTVSGEPMTIKTLLVDPSAVLADLTIPRDGFNHPGLIEGADGAWHTNSIGDSQINELIAWHYFLNPDDMYIYFTKNRLPAINQYISLPDTYEIAYNNLSPAVSQFITGQCLNNRSPETKSILTLYTGHIGLVAHNENLAIWQELKSGASLAGIVLSGEQTSPEASFDDSNNQFAGLKDPPFFSSWAGGNMLGQALQPSLNENVNLVGDPCLTLIP